jgi:putative ABC transport system substrate-binding protein
MRRREFFTLISGAAALPLAVRAQQSAFPVIGFLHLTSLEETRDFLAAFHRGLGETGYVENKNVTIEYRWGQGHNDRLPTLIEELARRQVSVIVMLGSTHGALAAKAATRTIPIVFMVGADPVQIGLVDSLSKPGGNLTGINLFNVEVAAKRLELLLQMVPAAKSVAYLRNPTSPILAQSETGHLQAAARALGVQLKFVDASDLREIEEGFTNVVQHQDALFVTADNFLIGIVIE